MILTIDIGGTNTRVALMDDQGQKIRDEKFSTDPKDPFKTLQPVIDFAKKVNDFEAIGISAPGPADYERGIFWRTPNLKGRWINFPFIAHLQKELNFKNIYSQNDANLMALACHNRYKIRKYEITQFFTISTGLGSGLIIGNRIFSGSCGQAQELANCPLAWHQESGKGLGEGSLELFCSGSGITYRGLKYGYKSAEEIFSKREEEYAKGIISDATETLANAIATVCAVVNPSLFVFDGPVARNNWWMVEKAIEIAKTRMFFGQYKNLRFQLADFGDDAALMGAFHYAKSKITK